jgi:hypothetical protein
MALGDTLRAEVILDLIIWRVRAEPVLQEAFELSEVVKSRQQIQHCIQSNRWTFNDL